MAKKPKFKAVWQHIKGTKPKRYKRVWQKIKPKYGVNGTVGPAVRFTWSETYCTDGSESPKSHKTRIVYQARQLDALRKLMANHYKVKFSDVSIDVNSWYRSPAYNKSIGGAKFSQHVESRATDIMVYVKGEKVSPHKVAEFAEAVPAFRSGGIGWYDKDHGSFTHVDHRPDGPARWINNG